MLTALERGTLGKGPFFWRQKKGEKERPPQGPIKSSFKRGILQLARVPRAQTNKIPNPFKTLFKGGTKGAVKRHRHQLAT